MSNESNKMIKLTNLAQPQLIKDEDAIYKALGAYQGIINGKYIVSSGILLATNKRLVFCNQKHISSFNYDKIVNLELSKRTLNGRALSFQYHNNEIKITNIKEESDIKDLYDFLISPVYDSEADFSQHFEETEVKPNIKQVKETKCTCSACGNVWFYGKEESIQNFGEKLENAGSSMSNAGKDMMCCGGCLPAAFIPNKQEKEVKDLNQCPNCNSKAVKKEVVVHNVE